MQLFKAKQNWNKLGNNHLIAQIADTAKEAKTKILGNLGKPRETKTDRLWSWGLAELLQH